MKVLDTLKNRLSLILLVVGLSLCFSFATQSNDEWVVPDKYKNMKNPQEANSESLDIGKTIFSKHCKSCHGKYGEGDGSKAAELDTPVGDFTDGSLDDQTDGALFYKTLEGRDDMPGFKKKIEYEEDIWHVINYIRELAE